MAFDSILFNNAAFAMFKQAHPALPLSHEELWEEVLNQFKVNDLSTAVEEMTRFSQWIVNWKLSIVTPVIDRITVGLQVPFQKGYMTLQLSAGFGVMFGEESGVETEADQRTINATAKQMVEKMFRAVESLGLAKSNEGNQSATSNGLPSQQSGGQGGNTEKHTVDILAISDHEGKRQYRAKGSWFSQFGAPIYPEVFKAANIDPSGLPTGQHQVKWDVEILRMGENKIKVTKITPIG